MNAKLKAALAVSPIAILIGLFVWSFFIPAAFDGPPFQSPIITETTEYRAPLGIWIVGNLFFALVAFGVACALVFVLYSAFAKPYTALVKRFDPKYQPKPERLSRADLEHAVARLERLREADYQDISYWRQRYYGQYAEATSLRYDINELREKLAEALRNR